MKKVISLVLALVMIMALGTTAFAAPKIEKTEGVTGDASITVNLPTYEEGYETENVYKIYKVFDAETIDGNTFFKPVAGKEKTALPEGFVLSGEGYVYHGTINEGALVPSTATDLTADEITAIQGYVTEADVVAEVTTTQADTSFTVTGLPYGYYYINTTTGSLVVVNTWLSSAEVSDKNDVPEVDKQILEATSYVEQIDGKGQKAIAQLGTDVKFEGKVTTNTGVENYVYHDTMDAGLKFNEGSVTVTVGTDEWTEGTEYTLVTTGIDETFKVEFKNDYTKGLADGTEIKIVYTAKLTDDALTVDKLENTAYLSWGRTPGENKTPTVKTEVYSAKFDVVKKDGFNQPLGGAGFVLQNEAGAYYKYTAADATTDESAKAEWYTLQGEETLAQAIAEGKVDEYVSDATTGAVPTFKGLTTGKYTLIENRVPEGYNPADDYEFEVKGGDYTAENLEQDTVVVNNKGTAMPITGGMGTTIFYVLGTVMVLGAAVLLITKRRMIAE